IIDAHYPHLKKATASLLVADGCGGFHWLLEREVIHDDHLHHQPSGQVEFYLSDFLDSEDLPIDFCRPPPGISRSSFSTISYQELAAVFRTARHVQHPDVFAMAEEDMETNFFREMQQEYERRIAEERSETERRIAEERPEAERRIAKERSKAERRFTEERRQRKKLDKHAAKVRRRLKILSRLPLRPSRVPPTLSGVLLKSVVGAKRLIKVPPRPRGVLLRPSGDSLRICSSKGSSPSRWRLLFAKLTEKRNKIENKSPPSPFSSSQHGRNSRNYDFLAL
ncbi:hypothetical protein B0H67DRAFT_475944, partial [Lasiosphaeris hirsuta]